MSGIEFEAESMSRPVTFIPKPKGFSAYLIKNGWAHDTSSANKLMIFLSVLIILASIILYFIFVSGTSRSGSIDIPRNVIERLPIETQQKIRNAQ